MSFGTGLSGLNAASKNLDVIGHNIANANTTGFKMQRAEFAEMYAMALGAAGGSNGGIGVSVATVAQLFTQGNIKITGNNLDLAINGEGMFKVRMTDGSVAYTRNGEFKLDKDGFIVTNNGARLQGYLPPAPGAPIPVGATADLVLPTGAAIAPRATGSSTVNPGISITANLPAEADAIPGAPSTPLTVDEKKYGTAVNIYDEQGNAIPLQIYFIKTAANQWRVVGRTEGANPQQFDLDGGTALQFDAAGQIVGTPTLAIPANAINADDYAPGVPSANFPAAAVPINIGTTGAWTLSQWGSPFAVYDIKQDGYAPGELSSIVISEQGIITARYSNGVSQDAGQVTLVRFRNLQGLEPVNGGYWRETFTSGQPIEGQPLSGRFGSVRQNALEESNVDLTQELVNMIVAQRHYQANAQTIKTQDQVQQTLVNLR
ncbi:MAG: flagellar hook protein FlgE [Tepidimonas ignava]|uniref:Flagellar hook protein FlgE n=1 Tax=Tepidimonas ignava TaxID=114249 RepID=A0A4R3L9F6_9BURK|nr:flagellar hook protein FlgE [Tepidimonas ignava]MCX7813913.1 flagellar hook protein FlgE [Tepidimonas ignava]TCS96262.1 flagellar hook protein FlgE [Tepidimonas ignava]TSE23607.1 Flagellar hook protein FlgE [Tepidimonas ignava]